MHPNNETIDPTTSNTFSFVFSGIDLVEYEYNFYDLFSGETLPIGFTSTIATQYDGDVVYVNVPASNWGEYTNHQLSYDVHLFGWSWECNSLLEGNLLYIPYANYGFAERVYVWSELIFGVNDVYVVPSSTPDYYHAYANVEAAKNGLEANRLVVLEQLSNIDTSPHSYSEQIPFRTAAQPSFILSDETAISGTYTVYPSYSHPNGYALNSYTFYLYDMSDNLLLSTIEIFSSNAKYTFEYLVNGQQYQIRFTGKNIIGQMVDTGKITMSVVYPTAFIPKTIPITATNECQYGRVKVNIPSHSPSFVVVENIGGEDINHTFTIVNTLVYRKCTTESSPQLIAVAQPNIEYYNDYMAQNTMTYDYSVAFYGTLDVGEYINETTYDPGYNVIENTNHTGNVDVKYYCWFLIDLDADKSYKFDALFEGGDLTQEDDFTKYKTNTSYSAYSVGNAKSIISSAKALVSVDNLNQDFHTTNTILREIADLVSVRNTNRKIVKDRRRPTRIFPVFTYGFIQVPLNNGIGYQPYICGFSFDQIGDTIE
jgi:hypothetical protein